jgi:DNA-directed RNA polymerase specialized sigma24 family protein
MNEQTEGTAMFLAILPALRRHACFAFRGMKDVHRFEDCVQETLALCWLWCGRLSEQGKDARDFPTTLAAFATRHVHGGRSFVGRTTYRNEPLSPLTQARCGFRTEAFSSEAESASSWLTALQDNSTSPVDEQAAFRIDFPAWLHTLTDRNRSIVEHMAVGDTTLELSKRYGLSPGRVSQLRRDFREEWYAYTEEAA